LKAIPLIKGMGGVKTICGISNISFGLPDRNIINSAFLSMAIRSGLDAAILDPTDKRIISSIRASNALVGMDDYCAQYLKAFREGRLA
ncbi:MAG: methyltetrahydrofolate cobalamin methyltransferase, partial [Candidatus Omnitrophota bacterium]|nr:methyltetrahydrofolate cobalamin methyltransferase [Candidatus Omnitrophota bacterium]